MSQTKHNGALNAAGTLMSLMSSLMSVRQGAKSFMDTYNSEGWSTLWANLPTYTPTADGSAPEPLVTDLTPVSSHPTVDLHKSSAQLVAGVVLLQQFLNLCQNAAVITAQYSQTIDDLAGF